MEKTTKRVNEGESTRREEGREEMGRKETAKRVSEWKRESVWTGIEAKEEVDCEKGNGQFWGAMDTRR